MTIKEKAERLLLTGAVRMTVIHDDLAAVVRGDHGEYTLTLEVGPSPQFVTYWRCPCPARKKCSHIEAVERVTG